MTFDFGAALFAGEMRCGLSATFGAAFTGDSRGFGFSISGTATCGSSLLGATSTTLSSNAGRCLDGRTTGDFRTTCDDSGLSMIVAGASVTGLSTGSGGATRTSAAV